MRMLSSAFAHYKILIYTYKMHASKCLMVLVVLSLFIVGLNGESQCSASANEKWNLKKRKCVYCKPCPQGTARNLTEPYKGPLVTNGNTRCLPCRECPKGSYAGENICLPCRINCVKHYQREFVEICEGSHDARCGSCLSGYEDKLRDIKLPCYEKETPATTSITGKSTYENVESPNYDRSNAKAVALEVNSSDTTEDNVSEIAIGLICVGVLLMVAAMVGVVITRRKKPCINTQESIIEEISSGVDNDLQIDGGGSAFSSRSEVRGELPASVPLIARPELSSQHNFGNTQPFGNVEYQPIPQTVKPQKLECGCKIDPTCQCYVTDMPDIEIQKSDKYIMIVSRKICHTERQLYEELKLDSPEIFASEDDRRLDPKGITLGEKVLSLLNRWVEKGPTPVKLHTLMKALCKARFHNINRELVKQYLGERSLENDNGGIV